MPLENEPATPATPVAPPTTASAPPPPATPPAPPAAEPDPSLDTAFVDAAASQRPATPSAPQPTTPQTPSPTAAQPAITPTLLARAQQANMPLEGIQSDADLANALLEHLQRINPYVQLGQTQLAAPQAPAAPAAAPAAEPEWTLDSHFQSVWKAPEWKPEYQHAIDRELVQADEQGRIVPAPGCEALVLPILAGMNEAVAGMREARANLFEGNPYRNFYDALAPAIEKRVEQMLEERFTGYQQTQQQMSLLDKFESDNAAWLYQPGTQTLTEKGQAFAKEVQALREDGVTNPERLLARAMQAIGGAPAPAPPAAAQPAAPAATAAERPRRPDGTFLPASAAPQTTSPATAPTKQESFVETARERAGYTPSRNSGASADDGDVPMTDGDLGSFFKRQHQASRQAAAAH